MRTRPATRNDLTFEYDGRPRRVCVSFYWTDTATFNQGVGNRRPRKVGNKWVVRRYTDRPLLVRIDRMTKYPDFVSIPDPTK